MNHTKHKWISKRSGGYRGAGLQSAFPVPPTPSTSSAADAEAFAAALEAADDEAGPSSGAPSISTTEIDRSSVGVRREREAGEGVGPEPKRKRAPRKPKVVDADDGGPAAKKGHGAKGKAKAKAKEPAFVSSIEWPDHFKKLERVFRALNTVYTFCSGRRHLATTFENLRGGVEGLLKGPIDIQDFAQLKALLPTLVRFAYIDRELLTVQEGMSRREERDEVYSSAGAGATDAEPDQHVLLFQFNDGEVKSLNGTGKVLRGKRWWSEDKTRPDPTVPVPKYSPNAMTKMIAKRDARFREAVDELLVACAAQNPAGDAVRLLLEATADFVPVRPTLDDDGQPVKTLAERKEGLDFFLRNPDKRPAIKDLIDEMRDDPEYKDQIVLGGHRVSEAREAVCVSPSRPLSTRVADALYSAKKITELYSHQAAALDQLAAGRHVIVSTSTSSGKSLIYQLPALEALEADAHACAMYIFPTKALAQDQKRSLVDLLANCEGMEAVKVATFDGDTPQADRDHIRDHASVIFTNPDMIHVTILPREETWRRFFRNLRLIVVDELHIYNGLFGCHVALIMRRLRRVCAALGNRRVQFVSCSATVHNPVEHMRAIFGVDDVHLVDQDGSPCGRKEHVVWNPPLIDDRDASQGRVSSLSEASRIFRFLMDRGVRCIVFCKIRRFCELLMKQVRQDLMLEGRSDMAGRVMSYRSGYSPQDRRRIEQEMFSGQLLGVIATTALELGIDIGSLDAVITVGFPYTLPGLRQQAGRAGRRNKDSLAMLILDPFPMDQHYAHHPDELFTAPHAQMSLDLDNEMVLEGHVQCAADEMPVHPVDDAAFFGPRLSRLCADRLVPDGEGFFHCHPRFQPHPARHVSIRNAEDERYAVVDVTKGRNRVMEEIEMSRVTFECFEGALFMHQGRTLIVEEVDHDARMCKLREANVDWMTKPRDFTDVDAMETLRIRAIKGSPVLAYYGRVQITSVVFGYFKVDRRNNILDTVDVDTPPFVRQSHGLWVDVPPVALQLLRAKNVHVAGSIHAAEHALLSLTPMFVMSVAGDVRTECKAPEKEFANQRTSRKRPARLILFDASGKSGGVSAKAFDRVHGLLTQAADVLANCRCVDGCPSCITSSICSQGNVVCSKLGARIVLECLIGRTPPSDSIPMQDPYVGGSPGETIVLAGPVKSGGEVVVVDEEGRRMGKEEAERRVEESRVVMRAQLEARSVEEVVDLEAAMGGFVR